MIMKYYIELTEPYAINIQNFLTNGYIEYPSLICIAVIGIMLLLFPRKMTRLIIYNHTGLVLAIIGWYVLSKHDFSNSSYFFIGTLCTHVTYFLNIKKCFSDNIYILLFLILLYFPIIDVVYEMDGVLFLTCIMFSIMILVIRKNMFLVLGVLFMGSCLVVSSIVYIMTQTLLGKYGFLGIFVTCCVGVLFNVYVKKDFFKGPIAQVIDNEKCKTSQLSPM